MIRWDVDPFLFHIGSYGFRWYSLAFLAAFATSLEFMRRVFEKERRPPADLDRLLLYCIISTILGARLGHCFFYEPELFLTDPLRVLRVWEGGLASHGAAIGILLAMALYARRTKNASFLWIVDRIVTPVALSGAFIRLGNLANSEIIGEPTSVPWAFVFERIDSLPRHPTQLYEAIYYFCAWAVLIALWKRTDLPNRRGGLLGAFLILIFGFRIFIEFAKENQVEFESGLPLNMGQFLSLPFTLAGIVLLIRALKRPTSPVPWLASDEPEKAGIAGASAP